jgi:hypothetical protein
MSYFCLLWVPLFYLFRRSVTGNHVSAGGIWALLAGSIAAFTGYYLGFFVNPEGFGSFRWLSGFVDLVCLPVLIPLLVYLFLILFRFVSGSINFADFTLLWLIPGTVMRAVSRSPQSDPILLVLVPVLWTAIAVGVSFFISVIQQGKIALIVLSSFGMLVIPFAAACSYWVLSKQKTSWGFLFFSAAAVPMLASMILSFINSEG